MLWRELGGAQGAEVIDNEQHIDARQNVNRHAPREGHGIATVVVEYLKEAHADNHDTIGQHGGGLGEEHLPTVVVALATGTQHVLIVHTGCQLVVGTKQTEREQTGEDQLSAVGRFRETEGQGYEQQADATFHELQLKLEMSRLTDACPHEGLHHPGQRQQGTQQRTTLPPHSELQEHQQRHEGDHGAGDGLCGEQGG